MDVRAAACSTTAQVCVTTASREWTPPSPVTATTANSSYAENEPSAATAAVSFIVQRQACQLIKARATEEHIQRPCADGQGERREEGEEAPLQGVEELVARAHDVPLARRSAHCSCEQLDRGDIGLLTWILSISGERRLSIGIQILGEILTIYRAT